MHVLVEYRFVISLALSAVAGMGGLHAAAGRAGIG